MRRSQTGGLGLPPESAIVASSRTRGTFTSNIRSRRTSDS